MVGAARGRLRYGIVKPPLALGYGGVVWAPAPVGVRPVLATQVPRAAVLHLFCPCLFSPFVVCTPFRPQWYSPAPLCLSRCRRPPVSSALCPSSSPSRASFFCVSSGSTPAALCCSFSACSRVSSHTPQIPQPPRPAVSPLLPHAPLPPPAAPWLPSFRAASRSLVHPAVVFVTRSLAVLLPVCPPS